MSPSNGVLLTYVIAVASLAAIYLLLHAVTRGQFDVQRLILGEDGRLSTSKFQAVLWTFIVMASYLAIYTARIIKGDFQPTIPVPVNLLILSGTSLGTFVAAKAITQSQISSGTITKPEATGYSAANLIDTDSGNTDLGKFQLVAWTLISAGIFLFTLHESIANFLGAIHVSGAPSTLGFPDLDTALLAFMGLSQGTYLVNKATTKQTPVSQAAGQTQAAPVPADATTQTASLPAGSVATGQ